jgi:hypothetical protein
MGKDKDTGEISVANLSNFFPSTYDTDPIMAIVSAARGKKPADEAAIDAMTEFMRPFVGEQILIGSLYDVARNKTKYGYEVFNETDGWFERQLKKSWHVAKTLRPGTMNRAERRIIPSLRGEQPAYGAKLEPTREIARELTGVSFEKFNYGTGFYNRSRETSYQVDKAMDTFTSPLYRPTTISEDDIFENYVEADKKRFMIWQEQRKLFMAAMRGGVSKREAVKLMTERGWSKAQATDIAKGIYTPYDVSGDMVNDARKRNHKVPMQRIEGYRRTVAKTRLDNP